MERELVYKLKLSPNAFERLQYIKWYQQRKKIGLLFWRCQLSCSRVHKQGRWRPTVLKHEQYESPIFYSDSTTYNTTYVLQRILYLCIISILIYNTCMKIFPKEYKAMNRILEYTRNTYNIRPVSFNSTQMPTYVLYNLQIRILHVKINVEILSYE